MPGVPRDTTRRIGLLGGSFNPAHEGHRHVSLEALKRLGLDEVWWLVSPQNPLKDGASMAPLPVRLGHDGRERGVTLTVEELPTSRAEKVAVLGDMPLVTVTPAVQQERGLQRGHRNRQRHLPAPHGHPGPRGGSVRQDAPPDPLHPARDVSAT